MQREKIRNEWKEGMSGAGALHWLRVGQMDQVELWSELFSVFELIAAQRLRTCRPHCHVKAYTNNNSS